jgi:iron complex transport system permease protein
VDKDRGQRAITILLAAGLLAVALLALFIGRYPRPGFLNPALLRSDPLALRLVLGLRLPRVVASVLVGTTLGAAGCVLQMLFANPLVEPGLIGVSQGSAFGAAVAIVLLAPAIWVTQLFAALFGFAGLALAYLVARRLRFGGRILRLVLSGIAVSAVFSAAVGLVKFVADPLSELPAITFWLLGGLSAVDWSQLVQTGPLVVVALVVLLARRWRLNLLTLDDRVSFSLGTAPSRERLVMLLAATVATASVISFAGIVGWVGLLVPHIARRLVGSDGRRVLPASLLIGGIFVVVSDTVARTVIAGEIPLGVVTSLVGAIGFIALLASGRVHVEK